MTLGISRTWIRRTRIEERRRCRETKNFAETRNGKMSEGKRIFPESDQRWSFIHRCSIKFNSDGIRLKREKRRSVEEAFSTLLEECRRTRIDKLGKELLLLLIVVEKRREFDEGMNMKLISNQHFIVVEKQNNDEFQKNCSIDSDGF